MLVGNEVALRLADWFHSPRLFDEAVDGIRRIEGRASVEDEDIKAEMLAYLTLGALAVQDEEPLLRPKLHYFVQGYQGLRVRTFDVVLANPPYSIKRWNREAWQSDIWGRNFLGTPPQGRADYAFFQHILKSLDSKTGRCAILFPHGVLFRNEEREMRRKLVELDLVECVLGLGPNLFYNSPMEACVVVCRTNKPKARKGRILFIDAVGEIARERAQSFLKPEHQERILKAYKAFKDEPGFAKVGALEDVAAKDHSLSIPLYVRKINGNNGAPTETKSLRRVWAEWEQSGREFWLEMDALVETLDSLSEKPLTD